MTIEESKIMWEIEKSNTNFDLMSKPMKKMYDIVDKLINEGVMTYEDFTNDMIDEITNSIIENTKSEEIVQRAEMVDRMCKKITEAYEAKYKDRESVGRDQQVQGNSSEV